MSKKAVLVVFCVALLGPAWSAWAAKDPTLIGWWWFDEGGGTVASDSSSYGNNGTLTGGPTWVPGVFRTALKFDGVDDYVLVPHNPSLTVSSEVTVAVWINPERYTGPTGDPWQGIIGKQEGQRSYNLYTEASHALHFSTGGYGDLSDAILPLNEWVHACAMIKAGAQVYYINGQPAGTRGSGIVLPGAADVADVVIGRTNEGTSRSFLGMIDDVRIYNRSLTQQEVQEIITGNDLTTGLATSPTPGDGATDIPQDAVLSWNAGETAASHNVYIGTSLEDVNSADQPTASVTDATYDPDGLFEFGQTYYWRVDEVNAAPDFTVFKGIVWSFTAEQFAYPVTPIAATASGSGVGMVPQNTINGSGLNANDEHSTEPTTMWMSDGVKPAWIQYEFDKVYKLDHLLVWNANQLIEAFLGFGAKTVTIEYSEDGVTWATLEGVPEFAKAPGAATCTANTNVDFGGVMAKFVKLTITANWGSVAPQTGLSEVRFFYVPVRAFEPQPASGTAAVGIETALNWRPGREATSHTVYIGTDSAAVAEGSMTGDTVDSHGFTPDSLNFATTYYWKVDEVGDGGTYAGDVWSFTTEEYASIDDFEAYNDDIDAETTIWHAWIDGLTSGNSGSQVGYDVSPFAEKAIIHSGGQSMPLRYNNSASPFYSEAERTFDTAQNWTVHGADTLSVYFRGSSPAFAQTASGGILMNAVGTDIWNNSDQFRYAYKTLNGNGTMVARVVSLYNSNVWAKGGVMIRQSIDAASTHAFMAITPGGSGAGNGASFQHRLTAAGASTNNDNTGAVVAAPYWVKIERNGNNFTGSISPDGVTWTQLGTAQTIAMTGPVLIGLALCSHDAAITTGAEFSDISTTGNVTGAWEVAEIGVEQPTGNSAEGLYVTVKDSSNKSATVANTDTAATARTGWQQWKIPLSDFTSAGVKMNAVKSIVIGVGNRTSPTAGGTGTLFIDDLGFGRPAAQ